MGKKQPKNIIKAADFKPIPNHKIASGIHASGGMGRMVSITGVSISRKVLDHPVTIPQGMAVTTASRNPHITLKRL
jgi:hypothetical protein